jgi:hypothetical protein
VRIDAQRATKLINMMNTHTEKNELTPEQAAVLCGKLTFATSSIYGRAHRSALKPLYGRQHSTTGNDKLTKPINTAFDLLREFLHDACPRWIPLRGHHQQPCPLVYADAFFKAGDLIKRPAREGITPWSQASLPYLENGWGCVIIPDQRFPNIGTMMYGTIPSDLVEIYCQTQAYIYFLEIIAQIIPAIMRPDLVKGHYMSFVDNEAAKHALIKGYGKIDEINNLASAFWRHCADNRTNPWFERVSTKANISDAISRGDLCEGLARGWSVYSPDMSPIFEDIRLIANSPKMRFNNNNKNTDAPEPNSTRAGLPVTALTQSARVDYKFTSAEPTSKRRQTAGDGRC